MHLTSGIVFLVPFLLLTYANPAPSPAAIKATDVNDPNHVLETAINVVTKIGGTKGRKPRPTPKPNSFANGWVGVETLKGGKVETYTVPAMEQNGNGDQVRIYSAGIVGGEIENI